MEFPAVGIFHPQKRVVVRPGGVSPAQLDVEEAVCVTGGCDGQALRGLRQDFTGLQHYGSQIAASTGGRVIGHLRLPHPCGREISPPGEGGLRLLGIVRQLQVHRHALHRLLACQQLPDGEGHLAAGGNGGAVHGFHSAEKSDCPGGLVPGHPLTAAGLVKGQVEGPTVKQVCGGVHRTAGEDDVRLGSVSLHADGRYLHGDAAVRAGFLHRLEELGYGGGNPV